MFDELLKPISTRKKLLPLDVVSYFNHGQGGNFLYGEKADSYDSRIAVCEGTADNYPFKNEFKKSILKAIGLRESILGRWSLLLELPFRIRTSNTFMESWQLCLENGRCAYQKAITSASKIRRSIRSNVKVLLCILCFG